MLRDTSPRLSADKLDEIRTAKLNGRDVHRNAHYLQSAPLPVLTVPDRLLEHPCSHLNDQTGRFHQRQERSGGHQPRLWVIPANERFDAVDAPRPDVHFWLIVKLELLSLERGSQPVLEREARLRLGMPRNAVRQVSLAARPRIAQRPFGILYQRVRILARFRIRHS